MFLSLGGTGKKVVIAPPPKLYRTVVLPPLPPVPVPAPIAPEKHLTLSNGPAIPPPVLIPTTLGAATAMSIAGTTVAAAVASSPALTPGSTPSPPTRLRSINAAGKRGTKSVTFGANTEVNPSPHKPDRTPTQTAAPPVISPLAPNIALNASAAPTLPAPVQVPPPQPPGGLSILTVLQSGPRTPLVPPAIVVSPQAPSPPIAGAGHNSQSRAPRPAHERAAALAALQRIEQQKSSASNRAGASPLAVAASPGSNNPSKTGVTTTSVTGSKTTHTTTTSAPAKKSDPPNPTNSKPSPTAEAVPATDSGAKPLKSKKARRKSDAEAEEAEESEEEDTPRRKPKKKRTTKKSKAAAAKKKRASNEDGDSDSDSDSDHNMSADDDDTPSHESKKKKSRSQSSIADHQLTSLPVASVSLPSDLSEADRARALSEMAKVRALQARGLAKQSQTFAISRIRFGRSYQSAYRNVNWM